MKTLLRIGAALLVIAAAYGVLCLAVRPSNDRPWSSDQALLPFAEFRGPLVSVHNIRNFRYASETRSTPAWYDRSFDLRRLESVWFFVEPFGSFGGAAHTFVSFGFDGDDFVAISVEIRKERGESFSAFGGLLRQYELMYVVGDERDLVELRTNLRRDTVYAYPVRTTRERMRQMFVDMLARANALRSRPEFYNTLTNTCTTNLVRHVNLIAPDRIPFRAAVLFPGYSDRLAYDLGLIDTNLPFEQARARYRINDRALQFADAPDFSRRIRE